MGAWVRGCVRFEHDGSYCASRGYRCAVIDRRGVWRCLRAPRFNIFGDVDDFEAAYRLIRCVLPSAPLFLYVSLQ